VSGRGQIAQTIIQTLNGMVLSLLMQVQQIKYLFQETPQVLVIWKKTTEIICLAQVAGLTSVLVSQYLYNMKTLLITFIVLIITACISSSWTPSQKGEHIGVNKHAKAKTKKIRDKTQVKDTLRSKGLYMLYIGCLMIAGGIGVSCAVGNKLVDTIGSAVGFSGGTLAALGLLLMKISELWVLFGWLLIIAGCIAAVVYCRDKSIFKRKGESCQKETKTK